YFDPSAPAADRQPAHGATARTDPDGQAIALIGRGYADDLDLKHGVVAGVGVRHGMGIRARSGLRIAVDADGLCDLRQCGRETDRVQTRVRDVEADRIDARI